MKIGSGNAREPRSAMYLRGIVKHPLHLQPLIVTIKNLSASGMMAEAATEFSAGDRIEVEIPRIGLVAATVAWARDMRFGARFDVKIDPAAAKRSITARA